MHLQAFLVGRELSVLPVIIIAVSPTDNIFDWAPHTIKLLVLKQHAPTDS